MRRGFLVCLKELQRVLLPRGPEMNEHKILKGEVNERVGQNCGAILKS